MKDDIRITDLRSEHLEQATDLMTRGFLHLNDLWKKYSPTYQDVYSVMRGKILPAIAGQWSFVLLKDQKIIGVSVTYDIVDYLALPSMPSNHQLFLKLNLIGKELESKLDLGSFKRGEALYGSFCVIDPKEAHKGLSLMFWSHILILGYLAGWKYYYSRISSPVSLKMVTRLGAQVIKEVKIDQREEKLWMVKMDKTTFTPTVVKVALSTLRKVKPRSSL